MLYRENIDIDMIKSWLAGILLSRIDIITNSVLTRIDMIRSWLVGVSVSILDIMISSG